MNSTSPNPADPPDISWDTVVKFVRQLSHDLRNHLNAVELQTAFMGEIATDKEMKDEVKRLREMLGASGAALQRLSSDMSHARPNFIPYKAAEFAEDLRQKFSSRPGTDEPKIEWNLDAGDLTLDVDPQLLFLAVQELIENARRFGGGAPLAISATADGNQFVLTFSEAKADFSHDLSKWGREPLKCISHGHYGLGLNRARIIVESHSGKLEANYDSKAKNLVTRIILPGSHTAG